MPIRPSVAHSYKHLILHITAVRTEQCKYIVYEIVLLSSGML
jgi:hypothetical protein